jgi:hypothetical protein
VTGILEPPSEEQYTEYNRLLHAMQTGVMIDQEQLGSRDGSPKHLRTGLNSAMVSDRAIVELLVEKGVFTSCEFYEKLNFCMAEEVVAYERRLGPNIHLK